MTPVRLELLGGFRLSIAHEVVDLPMNSQRLLAFLALQTQPMLRRFVSGSLWGDSTDERARSSLRSLLTRLPDANDSLVALTSDHIELSPTVAVNLREGEALARRVIDTPQSFDDVAEVDVELLTVDLLPDWGDDWVLLQRESYHQLRLRALEALCRRLTAIGRGGQAVQVGIAAVAGEPLRESARRVLIEAHIADGDVAAALREYNVFRELLLAALGRDPSDEMLDLVRGLKRH